MARYKFSVQFYNQFIEIVNEPNTIFLYTFSNHIATEANKTILLKAKLM